VQPPQFDLEDAAFPPLPATSATAPHTPQATGGASLHNTTTLSASSSGLGQKQAMHQQQQQLHQHQVLNSSVESAGGEEQRSSNQQGIESSNIHLTNSSSANNWAENRLSDVVRTGGGTGGKGKARKDNRHQQGQNQPHLAHNYQQQQQQRNPPVSPTPALGAEYGLQLQESNNTKNVTKQSSSNNNSIHVIKCQTPNINASSKEEAAGAQQHQQQLDKFNKTEDELHPKQPSQQRLVEGYVQQQQQLPPLAGHTEYSAALAAGAGACSVMEGGLTTSLAECSLGQHKKPPSVAALHAKKEANLLEKGASKHKSVATSTSTENLSAAATASKLSYAQVAQHHKAAAASDSKETGSGGSTGTLSPTGSHKMDLVFGDPAAVVAAVEKSGLATVSTEKRAVGGASPAVLSGKASGGLPATNTTQGSITVVVSAKEKGRLHTICQDN